MDSPNPGIGLLALIIIGRLWFRRRKMMDYPWIGRQMGLLGRRPWHFGMPWKKIYSGIR
jgi:MYXO-CTERM domain-containing protein